MEQATELHIRLMTANDFLVMAKWLSNQKVLEFYEEPSSNLERVIKKFGPRVEGKHDVTPCIIELKNKPIGYIQYYQIKESELKRHGYLANQRIYGIDLFIGETYLWGKGIGTSAIRMMLHDLSTNKNASKVFLEVKKENGRAISSYKKCGFKETRDLNHDLFLMERVNHD